MKTNKVIIDTREKPKAIEKIVKYFEDNNIEYEQRKLDVGDYMIEGRPDIIVDRKQTIDELAKNCTDRKDRERFKREMERAVKNGTALVLLVEQNRYKSLYGTIAVRGVEDLVLWHGKYTTIIGEQLYRILAGWCYKYKLRVEFCRPSETGRRIMEILTNA